MNTVKIVSKVRPNVKFIMVQYDHYLFRSHTKSGNVSNSQRIKLQFHEFFEILLRIQTLVTFVYILTF